jgi:hypothetical protein
MTGVREMSNEAFVPEEASLPLAFFELIPKNHQ